MIGLGGRALAAMAIGMSRAFPVQVEDPKRIEPGSLVRSHEEAVEIIEAFKPDFEAFVGRAAEQEELNTIYNVIRRSPEIDLEMLRRQLKAAGDEHERMQTRKRKNHIAPWSPEENMTRQQRRQRDRLAGKQRHF